MNAHLYIERIPVEKVPEDEGEAAKWLHELFVVKVSQTNYFDSLRFCPFSVFDEESG